MNRLKELREAKNLTQAALGKILVCSDATVARYESGRRGIDSSMICRLCDIFGCTADYLLCRSELPSPELTPEEIALLKAFRRADDRARTVVHAALEPFWEVEDAGKAI